MQQLAEGIYVETNYEGVNVGAIMTPRGIICIDAPSYPRDARHWAMRLRQINAAPVQYLILLDDDGDRILNTRWLNAKLVAHENTRGALVGYEKRYPQALLDSLIMRNPLAGKELSTSPVDRPDVTFTRKLSILKHQYEIELIHAPGPSAGTIWVHMPKNGILFVGDSLTVGELPPLRNADFVSWLDSLRFLKEELSDVTTIVPGRGPITDLSEVARMEKTLAAVQKAFVDYADSTPDGSEAPTVADQIMSRYDAPLQHRDWTKQQLIHVLDHVAIASRAKNRIENESDAETQL